MGRNKFNLVKHEDGPKGRHPAGRHADRTSAGRHGKKLGADVSEEAPQESGRALGAVAKGAAAVFFAAGVGLGISACTTGGGLKDASPDAGNDTDSETTTVDTDTGWDTDTGTAGPECGTGEADFEAVLEQGEKTLLGPEGHWMTIVDMSFNGQFAEVLFTNENFDPVNTEGEVVEEGDISSYALLSPDSSITVDFGGEEQTISLCGVYRFAAGVDAAHFTTDHEDGFMHCDYVDNGNLSIPEEYEFSVAITQFVQVMTHTHGFIPDIETGEDHECPGTTQEFVYEESTFEGPIHLGVYSVPGMGFGNLIRMRGEEFHFVESGTDYDGPYMDVAEKQQSTIFKSPFQSVSLDGLEATWTGTGEGGGPLFSYDYPNATHISEEDVSENEKIIRVWVGDDVKEFNLRFSTPGLFADGSVAATLLRGMQRITEGGQVMVNGEKFVVSLYCEEFIEGFRLTPQEE